MAKKKNDQAIINGGEEIEVVKFGGASETVKVKLLPVSQYEDYLKVIDKDTRAAELLCDKPEGWAEDLVPDSLMDVVEKGHDINFRSVFRWADRKARINETMLPIAKKGAALASQLQSSARTAPQ